MREIYVTSKRDLDTFIASLYLDIPDYDITKIEEGIRVTVQNDQVIFKFIKRFSNWCKKELLIEAGDTYFHNHEHEDKWKCWRMDKRFQEAYSDDILGAQIQRMLEEQMDIESDWDTAAIPVDNMLPFIQEQMTMRLDLINYHFTENFHEDFILLRQPPINHSQNQQPY